MRWLFVLCLVALAGPAVAQQDLCRTSPVGTSTRYCASEAFVTASAPKAWAYVSQTGGVYSKVAGYNIASIAKVGTGLVTINFGEAFASTTSFGCVIGKSEPVSGTEVSEAIASRTASSIRVDIRNSATPFANNDAGFTLACFE